MDDCANTLPPPLRFTWVALTLAAFFVASSLCYGQVSYPIFEHLTTDDGLSSDKVESILQDHHGFYWIATQNGLNRYDGTSFKIFRHHEGDSTSLTNDFCTALAEDSLGDIWIATSNGLSRYIRKTGRFQSIYVHHPIHNFEIANWIRSIIVDKHDDVWISGVGLWKYDHRTGKIIYYPHDEKDPGSISDNGVVRQTVYDSLRDGLWLIADQEINFLDILYNQFYHVDHNPKHWLIFDQGKNTELALGQDQQVWFRNQDNFLCAFNPEQNSITATAYQLNFRVKNVYPDHHGKIWLYHWAEIPEIFDPLTGVVDTDFFVKHHPRSILCERIQSVYTDKQENYWIASNLGISIYNPDIQYYHLHQLSLGNTNGLRDSLNILAMCQTRPGMIWISTDHGLLTYNVENEKSVKIPHIPPVRYVSALCADEDRVWMSAKNQLICIDANTKSILKTISLPSDIFFIRKGAPDKLWVGLWQDGLCEVNLRDYSWKNFRDSPGQLKSNDLVAGLVDDSALWIGYNGGFGFSKYDQSTNTFSHFQPTSSGKSAIAAGTITAMAKDIRNQIWLGTFGKGIFLFDESLGTYTNFQQDEGLKCNYINSVIPDAKGNLWISTADGMNYLKSGTHSISQLDMDLVFRSNGVVPNGMMGVDGHIYFFCYNSFVEIDPAAYHPEVDFPQMVISTFRVLNEEVPFQGNGHEISLTHNQNFFSFEFSALKTQPTKLIHYAYLLDGFDKDWNDVGEKTVASYTNVPGGHYKFKLKATNDQGQWSDALISIPVFVSPPFWRTWWFILLSLFLTAGIVYGIYRYRMLQLGKIYSIKAKISRDLHDDVGASLSSIHIYSSVAEEALKHDPQKAENIVQQIKLNSRQVMDNMSDIIWAMNEGQPDGESLTGRIKNYGYDLLSHKNIECVYDIDPGLEKKVLGPDIRKNILLIVKEALNNIAKYSNATHASVTLRLNGHTINIDIRDNGQGFDSTAVLSGNGLNNMKQRTQSLGGKFYVKSVPGEGTHIASSIPVAKISDMQSGT